MIHAFEHFGGIPQEILFDNMKTAYVYNNANCRWEVNVRMAAFAAHYGFTPRRCRAYRPKTKGKVEREVRYIRTSFLPTVGGDLSLVPTARLNELVELWLERVDNKALRDFGQTRNERFAQEREFLNLLPEQHFEYRVPEALFVNRDGKMTYKTNRYSMPEAYRGKQLEGLLDLLEQKLTLKYQGTAIRTLTLAPAGSKQIIIDPEDRQEHYDAWLRGRELEELIRMKIAEKRKRAQDENVTGDPAVYDHLFSCIDEMAEEVAV
jgi:hypothetical protein